LVSIGYSRVHGNMHLLKLSTKPRNIQLLTNPVIVYYFEIR
jgi:hypothetical protein